MLGLTVGRTTADPGSHPPSAEPTEFSSALESTPSTPRATGFHPAAKVVTRLGDGRHQPRSGRAGLLPPSLDLSDAIGAPTLAERPIGGAVLVAQVSLDSRDPDAGRLGDGLPYVLSRRGEWRRVRLEDYGYARSYGEMGVALSDDGQRLALNDNARRVIMVVDVATGTFVRHPVPAKEAVTMKWTSDNGQVLFSDRFRRKMPGWSLDVTTGAVTRTPYRVWFSDDDGAGRIWELTNRGRLRGWHGHRLVAGAALAFPDLGGAYPIAAGELFAVMQFASKVGGLPAPRGVAVFAPGSGDLVAFLDLGRDLGWTSPLGWLDGRTLLLHDAQQGVMRLWDTQAHRLSEVTRFGNHGVHVEVALLALPSVVED